MNASNRRWATFAALTSVVVLASLLPVAGSGPERFLLGVGFDKGVHLVGYAAVSFAFARAWNGSERTVSARAPTRRSVLLVAAAVAFGIGAGVEFLQIPLATRSASIADAGANAVGASVGALVWRSRW